MFQSTAEECRHLRLHNGSGWRWLRPVLGFSSESSSDHTGDLQPHFRVEHRSLPSGPTIVDSVANSALYYGLVEYLVALKDPPESEIAFDMVEANFYGAAHYGLDAQITWLHSKNVNGSHHPPGSRLETASAHAWLLEALPFARSGLERLNVAAVDIDYYLGIIRHRVETRQTGAVWQIRWLERHPESDMTALTAAYVEQQRTGEPVSCWSVPGA
jgi:hypothetical protein